MEFLKPKTSCKTSCFFLNDAMFWRCFWKNTNVNVFDDVLQNAKHRANNVNRPPLGALVVWYRWCDDGFGQGKNYFFYGNCGRSNCGRLKWWCAMFIRRSSSWWTGWWMRWWGWRTMYIGDLRWMNFWINSERPLPSGKFMTKISTSKTWNTISVEWPY